MREPTEDRLVARARNGSQEAFGELYDRYHSQIYRFVFVKVSDRGVAEDVTHDVFLKAWKNIGAYRDQGFPFSSWLYRIARNEIIDRYRTAHASIPIEAEDEDRWGSDEDVEGDIDRTITLEHVMAAIRSLKDEYQDVIMVRFVEERSVRETAAILDRSEGAVKLLQHRAMRALKKKLQS